MHDDVRPFSTVDEMNKYIIQTVNLQASSDDLIVHVGDLACFDTDIKLKAS